MRRLLLSSFVLLTACGGGEADERMAAEGPEALAALAVSVEAPAEGDTLHARRALFFSDGAGTFVYDALAAPQDDPAMGFIVGETKMLDGWRWWSERDSAALGPQDRTRATVRPDFAARHYVQRDTAGFFGRLFNRVRGASQAELTERITLLDGRGALLVEVQDSIGAVTFRPVVGDRGGASDYVVETRGPTLLIARGNYLERREGSRRPVWLAVRAASGQAGQGAREETPEAGRRTALALGGVTFPTPGAVVVATGDTPAAADSLAALALRDAARLTEQRSARLAALLDDAPFDTADESFDKALDWARLTLDALVSRDSAGTMLLPGIPGAEPPPGRSALTALDAFLYPGAWDTARRLLTTFGRVQRFDERIDILGRAPNVVRPGGQGDFTSADATPLYIAAAGDYVRATGDRGLVSGEANFWFKTVFAMRGLYGESRRYGRQVDEDGFLRANDDQTWMQDGASRATLATPRGGLVVEGQGALYEALRSMTEFAQIMGVSQRESGRWYADSADVLLAQFPERFVRDGRVLDRLDPRRGPDATLRPNALLALDRLDLPPAERARLARALAERLAYAHGVATRPQGDSLFHPFLDAPAYYAPEDARYNGAVWTWLSGPLIRLMAETGAPSQAYDLYGTSTELVLEDGVVGAIPDVLDAHPRASGERPRSGGAAVQPWSLAEYVRNAYEVFAGITYASASEVIVEPQLPESWGETATQVRMGRGHVRLALEQRGNALEAVLTPEGRLPTGAQARVRAFGLEAVVPLTADTLAAEPVTVRITPGGVEVAGEDVGEAGRYATPDASWWDGFAWVRPDLRDEYPVMRQAQAQRQLTPEQILRDNPAAEPILTQTDPDGDDWGATSTFTYPVGYPPSILDATYLEVVEDDSTTYFRAEFVDLAGTEALGYQPTFVVLALDMEGGGERRIGRNAGYDYPRGEGYEVVVFIGDGVRVEDARGRVLGEVPPSAGSVFDPATASLSFALPRFVLEDVPRGTSVTLLVGAREPGNGVGAFRSVARQASESVGGGKVDDRAPNVYDVITGRVSR